MGTPKGKRRDFEALEKRRFEAMLLLDEGLNQSETARRLTVAAKPSVSGYDSTARKARPGCARPAALAASRY